MTTNVPVSSSERVISLDAEANGLGGQVFCVSGTVSSATEEIDRVTFRCPIVGDVDEWVRNNVLPAIDTVPISAVDYPDLLRQFRAWHERWAWLGLNTVAHVVWPVEARLLLDMYPGEEVWSGPYPLIDVASMLYQQGHNPVSVDEYLTKRGIGLPTDGGHGPHHPLYDCRAAALAHWDLLDQTVR